MFYTSEYIKPILFQNQPYVHTCARRKIFIISCSVLFSLCICELSAFTEFATEYKKTGKEALSGLFFGVGLSQSSFIEEITCVQQTYSIWGIHPTFGDRCIPTSPIPRDLIKYFNQRLKLRISSVTNIKKDTRGRIVSCEAHDYIAKRIISGKNNKMGGSLLIGYGQFICNNIYCGLELGADIVSNKERFVTAFPMKMVYINLKQHGVTPSLSARFGFYSDELDTMLYAKAGVTVYSKNLKTELENISLTRIMPSIGIGIEKTIGLISLRCEFDYFPQKSRMVNLNCYDKNRVISDAGYDIHFTDMTSKIRIKQKGYAVRIMAVMHL